MENMEEKNNNKLNKSEESSDQRDPGAQHLEQSDALVGDVHPTERSDTFQEQRNAESENESESGEPTE